MTVNELSSQVQKTMAQHIVTGITEMFRDFYIAANLHRLQQYVPSLTKEMIGGFPTFFAYYPRTNECT